MFKNNLSISVVSKTNLLIAALLVCLTATAAQAQGQQTAEKKEDVRYVEVAKISGTEGVQEFQRNVQIIQAQRMELVRLNEALAKAKKGSAEHTENTKLIDTISKQLADNNKKMYETYRFTLARNYTLVPDKITIYLELTPEEALKSKQGK